MELWWALTRISCTRTRFSCNRNRSFHCRIGRVLIRFFFLGDIGMDYVFGFISISLTHINEINGSQVIENEKRFNYNCNLLSGKQGCSPHNLRWYLISLYNIYKYSNERINQLAIECKKRAYIHLMKSNQIWNNNKHLSKFHCM